MASITASNSSAGTWYSWNSGTTTSGTDNTWNRWVTFDSSATTTSSSTSATWVTWNEQGVWRTRNVYYSPPPETEAQHQARLQREEHARVAAEERRRKEAEALQKAEDLLIFQLNAKQLEDWKKNKAFDVVSQSGKRFRIRNQASMNVNEYDANGKIVASHCIVPQSVSVPLPDQLVMQKLMLENHEADFMRIANHRAN